MNFIIRVSAFLLITVVMMLNAIAINPVLTKELDRSAYYTAMASNDVVLIDKELKAIQESSIKEKDGFEGALLMKRAGLATKVKQKLAFFKEGHQKLESSIATNVDNAELHFLRLMIQENAPKVLNYNKDMIKDKKEVLKSYKNLPAEVQKIITEYSKTSKIITLKDL
ncbi:MAG: hypothetical protein HY305_06570 [Sphingobacteriales bacterium]|nr:hypothetical protein [Sphingobacteriales bacterium]